MRATTPAPEETTCPHIVTPIVPPSWAPAAPSPRRIRSPRWPASAMLLAGRQRGRRRRRGRLHAERRRAVHVERRRHRAHARSRARARRAPRARLHRPAPRARPTPRECTEDELAGGPEGVRDARQPGRLAGRARALRHACRARRVLAPAIELAENGVPLTFKNVDVLRAGAARRSSRSRGGASGSISATAAPRPGKVVTYKELAGDVPAGGGGRRGGLLPRARSPRRSRARCRRRAAGSPRRTWPRSRPEWREPRAHHVPRPRGLLGAAAVLRLPDAGDAEHPGGLRPARAGATTRSTTCTT